MPCSFLRFRVIQQDSVEQKGSWSPGNLWVPEGPWSNHSSHARISPRPRGLSLLKRGNLSRVMELTSRKKPSVGQDLVLKLLFKF